MQLQVQSTTQSRFKTYLKIVREKKIKKTRRIRKKTRKGKKRKTLVWQKTNISKQLLDKLENKESSE